MIEALRNMCQSLEATTPEDEQTKAKTPKNAKNQATTRGGRRRGGAQEERDGKDDEG